MKELSIKLDETLTTSNVTMKGSNIEILVKFIIIEPITLDIFRI